MDIARELSGSIAELQTAILIYRRRHLGDRGARAFATIHPVVRTDRGDDEIGAGRLMTMSDLTALIDQVRPLGKAVFLPERVLAAWGENVIWWRKASTERLWFKGDGGKTFSVVAPVPALVFMAGEERMRVWALKDSRRPTIDTNLFRAPFENVSLGGAVCLGNSDVPNSASPSNIELFERGFFGSRFTHPNVADQSRLTKRRGGLRALWKSLDGKPAFDVKTLVAAGQTLGQLMEEASREADDA